METIEGLFVVITTSKEQSHVAGPYSYEQAVDLQTLLTHVNHFINPDINIRIAKLSFLD